MANLAVLLDDGLTRLGIDLGVSPGATLDPAARTRLLDYMALLQKWSAKTNLIAKNASDVEVVEHFLDSLATLPLLSSASLMDVGSGAGFPGLVAAAARPELAVNLIEPRQKRAAFLRQVIRSLRLPHVACHECRLEDIAVQSMPCGHIVSRAVADIAGFLGMIEPWLSQGVQIICMKSRKWPEELARAQEIITRLGLDGPRVTNYRLPFSGVERVTLTFTAR
ncbi:MAG: 16S rRNA (guanine(527)-N(7))-methyltransferase RsmG [Desulfobulbaceae bacterium]|jgi:16S rRNA (guanine527-N7)-methyltransferase|nr:16S rRNA (guanine(527)-N(7))-methyltransferase RsmG [Desulfobulbaceae bacterium]